jgi:hypothetical protein
MHSPYTHTPCTIHRTLTMHHAPCTMHHAPYTMHHTPYTHTLIRHPLIHHTPYTHTPMHPCTIHSYTHAPYTHTHIPSASTQNSCVRSPRDRGRTVVTPPPVSSTMIGMKPWGAKTPPPSTAMSSCPHGLSEPLGARRSRLFVVIYVLGVIWGGGARASASRWVLGLAVCGLAPLTVNFPTQKPPWCR